MNFDTGRAIKLTREILQQDALALAPLSVLLIGLPSAAMTYATDHFTRSDAGFADPSSWFALVGSMLVAMLSSVAMQAIIVLRFEKRRGTTGDKDSRDAVSLAFDLVALGLVTTLGILAGFLLLIIPGIILSLAWFVVVPAMITERLGVLGAIRRSNALTGNARGAIFGLWIMVGLASAFFTWLIQIVIGAIDNAVVTAIADPAIQALFGLVDAAVAVAVYDELRWSQEGARQDDLKAIFD